jgi:hypothetical protein
MNKQFTLRVDSAVVATPLSITLIGIGITPTLLQQSASGIGIGGGVNILHY